MTEIDYTKPNFVHADLTLAEFRELQADRGESIIGFAFKTGFRSKVEGKEPSTYGLIKVLVKRDKNLLKLQLVHTLRGRRPDSRFPSLGRCLPEPTLRRGFRARRFHP